MRSMVRRRSAIATRLNFKPACYLNKTKIAKFIEIIYLLSRFYLPSQYVDDMVLVHPNKTVLADAIPKIRDFLQGDLKLSLHPKKIHLQEASRGFAFLGAWLLPNRVRLGRRILGNLRNALRNPCGDAVLQCARVRSYMGM
jgi:hypothetical protein